GQAIAFQNRGYEIPRVHLFNAGFEFDLPWKTVLEASYVGSRTRKYPVSQSLSAVPYAARVQGIANPSYLNPAAPNPFFRAPEPALHPPQSHRHRHSVRFRSSVW